MSREPIQISQEQIDRFQVDGFLVIENLIDADLVKRLGDRLDPLFHGKFETGIYPDAMPGRAIWRSPALPCLPKLDDSPLL
jgi:hypothetical protein